MILRDPRSATTPWYARWALPLLQDARDGQLVALAMQCAGLSLAGVGLFFAGRLFWWGAAAYWAILAVGLIDRYTLMLHCTSHRQLFRREHAWLNRVVPWVLAPFFGQTPETYFAHHMGMHHREENVGGDVSSTMRYQRDSFPAWLRYWARFMTVGLLDLARYFARRRKRRLLRRVVVGEAVYWVAVATLLVVKPAPTLVVFVAPLLLIRTLMMMGNWAQHAFVCPERPDDPYRSSITCINTRYNRRCFNDGYHAVHHVTPGCHWTDHPAQFERTASEHGAHDAVVLDGLDFFQVWLLLMTQRWERLARAFVRLPGAPARTQQDVIALLRSRMRPIPCGSAQTGAAPEADPDHHSAGIDWSTTAK